MQATLNNNFMKQSIAEEVLTSLRATGSKRYFINYEKEAEKLSLSADVYKHIIKGLAEYGYLSDVVYAKDGCAATISGGD